MPSQPRRASVRADGEAAPAIRARTGEPVIEAVAQRPPALEPLIPVAAIDAPRFANVASVAIGPPRFARLAPLVVDRALDAPILPVGSLLGLTILASASTPLDPVFVAAPATLRTSLAAAPTPLRPVFVAAPAAFGTSIAAAPATLGTALATAFLIGLDVLALALAAAAAPILFERQDRHRHRQSAYAREQPQLTHDPFLP